MSRTLIYVGGTVALGLGALYLGWPAEAQPSGKKTKKKSKAGKKAEAAAVEKDDTPNVVGLRNIGNTCFMNSILQALSNTPEFHKYLAEIEAAHSDEFIRAFIQTVNPPSDVSTSTGIYNPVHFHTLLTQEAEIFRGRDQHDAHELFNYVLSILEGKRSPQHQVTSTMVDSLESLILQGHDDQKHLSVPLQTDPTATPTASPLIKSQASLSPTSGSFGFSSSGAKWIPASAVVSPSPYSVAATVSPPPTMPKLTLCSEEEEEKQPNGVAHASSSSSSPPSPGSQSPESPRSPSTAAQQPAQQPMSMSITLSVPSSTQSQLISAASFHADSSAAVLSRDPFTGMSASLLKCTGCGYESPVKIDRFSTISLHFPATREPMLPIASMLQHYTDSETVDGIRCIGCSAYASLRRLEQRIQTLQSQGKRRRIQELQPFVDRLKSTIPAKLLSKPSAPLHKLTPAEKSYSKQVLDNLDLARRGPVSMSECEVVERATAQKQLKLVSLPSILVLHFTRLCGDMKINTHVQLSLLLDMSRFLAKANSDLALTQSSKASDEAIGAHTYLLSAVVVHHGGAYSGHFTCFRRLTPLSQLLSVRTIRPDSELTPEERQSVRQARLQMLFEQMTQIKWVHVSDESVQAVTIREVMGSQAYLAFYEKLF